MTDKRTSEGQHDEEDLLADFRDVLGEDDDKEPSAGDDGGTDGSTDLDALDAFLSEFGQSEAAPRDADVADLTDLADLADVTEESTTEDLPDAAAEENATDPLLREVAELAAEDEPAAEMDLDLDAVMDEVEVPELSVAADAPADELDLDMDMVEDMAAPEPPQPYSAHAASGGLFAAPAAPTPPPAAPAGVPIMAAEDEPATGSKALDVSTIGVALFSMVLAAVAGWFALSLHGQMNDLRAELAQLRQQPAGVIAGPDRQTQENLAQLTQRVNELAVLLDGPMSHLSDAGAQLSAMTARLDALEQRVGGLRDELAAAKPVARAPEKPKAASPAPQPAPRPVATAAKPAGSGGWVVNVASLTDARSAAAEQQRLKQAGFTTEVQTAQMEGRTWYRVRATGFSSREEAQVYSDMIRHKMDVTPWVGVDK